MAAPQGENRFPTADVLPAFFTLIVGAIFGGSMVFLTPPFDVPEEWQHFFRSYQCSQGIVYSSSREGVPGGDIPSSMCAVSDAIQGPIRNEYQFKIPPETLRAAWSKPLDPARTEYAQFPVTARYSPVPYLPAAAAMRAGQLAGLTALEELYAGRAGTLIGYLFLVVAAVWIMPVQKWLMALVALMPTSVFLAASVSADALSIAFPLLAFAMILRLALQPSSVDRRNLRWLAATLLLVGLVKPAYVLMACFFVIVPQDKFASRGECWRARASMIGLPLAAGLAWVLSVRGLCVPLRPGVDVTGQAHWILANPWPFAKRVIARLADGYLYAGIIATLGWGTVWIASKVYYIYWTGLLAAAVFDGSRDEVQVRIEARAFSYWVFLLVMAAIATITFLMWHPVGDNPIHGVQSRYFVPVLPLMLLPIRAKAKWASSRYARWLVPAVAIAVVLIGIGATWQAEVARYYRP
jgi:uncharacterized membrane protein